MREGYHPHTLMAKTDQKKMMSMDTLSVVTTVGVGLCIAAMGLWQAITGNASLLHGYHRSRVDPADVPKLARATGVSLVAAGASCCMLAFRPLLVPGVALMIASTVACVAFIVRYNGALIAFSSGSASPAGGPRPRRTVLGRVVLAATAALGLASLVCGVAWVLTLPETVPVHFDAAGAANRWGSRYELLLLPVISAIILAALLIAPRFDRGGMGGAEALRYDVALLLTAIILAGAQLLVAVLVMGAL